MLYGLDVSEYQSASVITKDYSFVIIRAYFESAKDIENMNAQIKRADELGIPYGLYYYSFASDSVGALDEARKMVNLAKTLNVRLGIWTDIEDKNFGTYDERAKAFCDYVANAGYYTGIYCSESMLDYFPSCKAYDKWVALWEGDNDGTKPTSWDTDEGTLWQYSSTNGALDVNVCRYDDLSFYNVQPNKECEIDAKKSLLEALKELIKQYEY